MGCRKCDRYLTSLPGSGNVAAHDEQFQKHQSSGSEQQPRTSTPRRLWALVRCEPLTTNTMGGRSARQFPVTEFPWGVSRHSSLAFRRSSFSGRSFGSLTRAEWCPVPNDHWPPVSPFDGHVPRMPLVLVCRTHRRRELTVVTEDITRT